MDKKISLRGEVGSQFWIRMLVNTLLKDDFDVTLGDKLRWISPVRDENYKEYKLSHENAMNELGLDPKKKSSVYSFWPGGQPQWDGIAVSKKSKILYLVEAKAYLDEMKKHDSSGAEDPKSIKKIEDSMRSVCKEQYDAEALFNNWTNGYYQLANRLTFLQKMKDMKLSEYPNVKLVLLNFVNDYTKKPTLTEEWKDHYRKVFKVMTGSEAIPKDVIMIFHDVKHGTMVKETAPE